MGEIGLKIGDYSIDCVSSPDTNYPLRIIGNNGNTYGIELVDTQINSTPFPIIKITFTDYSTAYYKPLPSEIVDSFSQIHTFAGIQYFDENVNGQILQIGGTDGPGLYANAASFIIFKNDFINNLPSSNISKVELCLYYMLMEPIGAQTDGTIECYEITSSIVDGSYSIDPTKYYNNVTYDPVPLDSIPFTTSEPINGYKYWNITNAYNSWKSDINDNNGLILKMDDNTTYRNFTSSDTSVSLIDNPYASPVRIQTYSNTKALKKSIKFHIGIEITYTDTSTEIIYPFFDTINPDYTATQKSELNNEVYASTASSYNWAAFPVTWTHYYIDHYYTNDHPIINAYYLTAGAFQRYYNVGYILFSDDFINNLPTVNVASYKLAYEKNTPSYDPISIIVGRSLIDLVNNSTKTATQLHSDYVPGSQFSMTSDEIDITSFITTWKADNNDNVGILFDYANNAKRLVMNSLFTT